MAEKIGTLNDFVHIDVKITGHPDSIESAPYAEVHDLFESHFKEAFDDPENLKQYGIDVYKIKIGDELKVYPSRWTIWFCEDKGLSIGENYDFQYKVENIEIKYYSKGPGREEDIPLLKITIELERI